VSSDPQAQRLYDFENSFMRAALQARCTLKQLQKLADKACRRWRVPTTKVVFAQGPYWYGLYYEDFNRICLYDAPKRRRIGHGRNMHVLLHEVGHHIDACLYESEESHGPVFAAIILDLYDHYGVLPEIAFRQLAAAYNIKIANLKEA